MVSPNFKFIQGMADGPESQIDPSMANMLRDLQDKSLEEVRTALHKALDFGARYALCSSFVMIALDIEWKRLGGSSDDPAPWRALIEAEEDE